MSTAEATAAGSELVREFMAFGRAAGCAMIDMHCHIGGYYGGAMPSAPLDRMLAQADRAGVERMVASHHIALAYDIATGNAEMARIVSQHPDRFLAYWVVNPNARGEAAEVRHVRRTPGFVGFKLWPDYHFARVTSAAYEPALRHADEHGLLVLSHCWGSSRYGGPAILAEAALRYPNATFLAGHSGHGEWDVSAQAARDVPNLYLDLCSVPNPNDARMEPDAPRVQLSAAATPPLYGIIEELVAVAGARKVLFGSDLPWYSQHYHAAAVLFARISDQERRDILRDNAVRLLAPFAQEPGA